MLRELLDAAPDSLVGIPLFIEEMTKAVLEAESQGDAEQTVAAVSFSAQAVPASLTCDLPVQARPGARRCLWHLAARTATHAARSHRRNVHILPASPF
jgi:hypothetical protein